METAGAIGWDPFDRLRAGSSTAHERLAGRLSGYREKQSQPQEAADAVKAFHPKIVIPYHYRGSDLTVFQKAPTVSAWCRRRRWRTIPRLS
jgi:hypothetical protein